MPADKRFKLFVPVMGFIALVAVGLVIWQMQAGMERMKGMAAQNQVDTSHKMADNAYTQAQPDSLAERVSGVSYRFCAYLDSIDVYMTRSADHSFKPFRKTLHARIQSTRDSLLSFITVKSTRDSVDRSTQFTLSRFKEFDKVFDDASMDAKRTGLIMMKHTCEELEASVIASLPKKPR